MILPVRKFENNFFGADHPNWGCRHLTLGGGAQVPAAGYSRCREFANALFGTSYAQLISFEKPKMGIRPMRISFHLSLVAATLLGCCSGARASCDVPSHVAPSGRAAILPVQTSVEVKLVKGAVEYAYDGTGWRSLSSGKHLRAGATVRAAAGSEAILKVDRRSSLVRVSPATSLHITMAAPADEISGPVLARASGE